MVLNNINAVPVGYLFTPAAAVKIDNAAGFDLCDRQAGCTPQQAATLSVLQNYPGQPSVQAARPYPQYGTITIPHHNTYANYNGLQITALKRAGAFDFSANYTFSKALGVLGSAADFNYTAPVDPFNIRRNYGPMAFDRSQILNLTYSYQVGKVSRDRVLGLIANGWLVSGITNLQSGGNMQTGVSGYPNFQLTGYIGNGTTG